MTLMNSCYPTTLVHVVLLISTLCTVGINSTNRLSQLETSLIQQRSTNVVGGAGGGYDGTTRNDNKRYRNSFDIKTDINNLFYNGNIQQIQSSPSPPPPPPQQSPSTTTTTTSPFSLATRKRHDTVTSQLTTTTTTTNSTVPPPTPIIIDNVSLLNLSYSFLNAISANSFRNLTQLTILDLSHNTIECFHLEAHKTLKILNLSANSLTTFNSEWCESLEQLDLSVNKLNNTQTIKLQNLINLSYVDLSCNELSEIDANLFYNTSNLRSLMLSGNRLRYIAGLAQFQLKNLEFLDLSYNDISDIDSDVFRNLVNLQTLDLSYNQFNGTSLQALQSIPDLARLSVAGNVLTKSALQEFAVTWSIKELDYSNVGLCDVPYSLAQSVRILNLNGNFVNIICSGDVDSYPLLHKLVLSNNQLTAIEDDALGRLEMLTFLYLDHNNLTQFPSSLPSNLIKLYINSNHISDIRLGNLVNLINLEVLDMSENQMLYLPQFPLPNLLILNVKSCGLHGVNHNLVQSSPKLRFLSIHGNLIKCSELLIIDQCRDDANETIIDPVDTAITIEQNDLERKDRYLNSQSYFVSHINNDNDNKNDDDDAEQCCQKGRTKRKQQGDRLPNCWNDEQKQKLITSLNLTNEPDLIVLATSAVTTTTTTTTSNDNKFKKNDTIISKDTKLLPKLNEQKNDENLSTKTIQINNKAESVDQKSVAVLDKSLSALQKPQNKEFSTNNMNSKKITMKNSQKSTISMKNKGKLLMKKVQSMANNINGVGEDVFLGGSKNLSLEKIEAITTQKGLTNSILMKSKQITTITNSTAAPIIIIATAAAAAAAVVASSSSSSLSLQQPIEGVGNKIKYNLFDKLANENQTSTIINSNFIKNKQLNKAILTPIAILPPKAISDNETHYNGKSIAVENVANNYNNSHNGQPLEMVPRNIDSTGNDGVEATDHHLHTINQTLNSQKPEQWNDIRNDSTNSHPGLLIVVGILSTGVLFTLIVVYVYRCNFVTSTRTHRCRRRGSCESINEARNVLNDNFNEETHSFTTQHVQHQQQQQQQSNGNEPFALTINQCDLLPMDVLNSTLSQSVDQPNISMQVW